MRRRDYDRRVALKNGHPEWVVQFGCSRAARRVLGLLLVQPAAITDLAEMTGYEDDTIEITLNALRRLGQAMPDEDRVRLSIWRAI